MILLKSETSYKIYRFLFIALVFCIPVHDKLVPPVILLICLIWLAEFNFIEKLHRLKLDGLKRILLLPVFLYLLYLIGTLYSEQVKGPSGALFDLEVKLSLLLFPVIILTLDRTKLGKDFHKKVLKAFLFGCLVSSIIIMNKAVMNYFKNQDSADFFYMNLSWMHHPSYLSMFFTFAVAVLVVWLVTTPNKDHMKRIAVFLFILHLTLFIALLSSKAGIVGFGLTLLLLGVFTILKNRNRIKAACYYITIILLIFGIFLFIFPFSFLRFNDAKKSLAEKHNSGEEVAEGSAARIMVWKSSLEIIRENLIFGLGTGDVKSTLNKKYQEKNIQYAIKENLNAHNQYFQTFIAIGILGFVTLLAIFIIPVIQAFKNNNLLLFLFLGLFAFHISVESMLERQAGTVFFAFFYSLLNVAPQRLFDSSNPKLPEV